MFLVFGPLKDSVGSELGAPKRGLWLEVLLEEKEKLGATDLGPKEPKTALSTFWPKLNVTPVGTEEVVVLLFWVKSSGPFPNEHEAAAVLVLLLDEEKEAAGGGAEAAGTDTFSFELTSDAPAPYFRSMLARCRS